MASGGRSDLPTVVELGLRCQDSRPNLVVSILFISSFEMEYHTIWADTNISM